MNQNNRTFKTYFQRNLFDSQQSVQNCKCITAHGIEITG